MTRLLALLAVAWLQAVEPPPLPCLFWPRAADDTVALVKNAGLDRLCVPAQLAESWRAAGLEAVPLSAADLASRETLAAPGIEQRVELVSATRSPWLAANGWRFLRHPAGHYRYDVKPTSAAIAAAEAFAYGADAVLSLDTPELAQLGLMMLFLRHLPAVEADQPLADFGVVDDGSEEMGEVMNMLVRRNLLFETIKAPAGRDRINVVPGGKGYSRDDMADPSEFALTIRHQLTDAARTIRLYGTEVVICRVTESVGSVRLHLLNYGGREVQGLRVRIRGKYRGREAHVFGAGRVALDEFAVMGEASEFSIPRMTTYAVVDLEKIR